MSFHGSNRLEMWNYWIFSNWNWREPWICEEFTHLKDLSSLLAPCVKTITSKQRSVRKNTQKTLPSYICPLTFLDSCLYFLCFFLFFLKIYYYFAEENIKWVINIASKQQSPCLRQTKKVLGFLFLVYGYFSLCYWLLFSSIVRCQLR